ENRARIAFGIGGTVFAFVLFEPFFGATPRDNRDLIKPDRGARHMEEDNFFIGNNQRVGIIPFGGGDENVAGRCVDFELAPCIVVAALVVLRVVNVNLRDPLLGMGVKYNS